MSLLLVLSTLAFAAILDAYPTNSPRLISSKRKGPYKVYRVYPNSTDDLDYCVELWKSASSYRVNFWKEPSRVGSPVDVMVPADRQSHFEALLNEHDLGYMVTIQDVQKLIEERERPSPFKSLPEFRQLLRDDAHHERAPFFDFRRYHSYEDMRIYMRSIERRYPEWAKVYSLGFSHEGRPIEMMKIGYQIRAKGKKSIWIDAGIHAREWASSTTAIYFIHQLATKFGKDPQITQYVKELNWYISPVLNPDGYEYTRTSTDPEVRMWRKNRALNREVCKRHPRACCLGVDLNRNFDFHWGESGASDNPCEEIYQGSAPFSEPESRAVRDFILAHKNDVQAVLTMHTYSQIWVHPFGHQRYSYPPDVDDLRETGTKAVAALEKLYGTKYKVGSGADTLYPAAGGSDDWSKSKAGIKFVYLLELRPEENVWDGFILDANEILPTARETWEGVKVVVNDVLKRLHIEPVSDDSNLEGSVADSSPKHSPPFSTLRRASSRFEQRERTEGGDESDDLTTLDATNSSFLSFYDITGFSPDNVNFSSALINYVQFNPSSDDTDIRNASDTSSTFSPASSSWPFNSVTDSTDSAPSDIIPRDSTANLFTPLNSSTDSNFDRLVNMDALESLFFWFDLASELRQAYSNQSAGERLPFNQSNSDRLSLNKPAFEQLLYKPTNAGLPSNQSADARLSSNQSAVARLSSNQSADARLPSNQSAVARLSSNQSAGARLSSNQSTDPISTSTLRPTVATASPTNNDTLNYTSTNSEENLELDYFLANYTLDFVNDTSLLEYVESLQYSKPRQYIFVKEANSSSLHRKQMKLIETTNADASGSCSDFIGEDRCVKWVHSRNGICERLVQFMRQKCAKTCHFCSNRQL